LDRGSVHSFLKDFLGWRGQWFCPTRWRMSTGEVIFFVPKIRFYPFKTTFKWFWFATVTRRRMTSTVLSPLFAYKGDQVAIGGRWICLIIRTELAPWIWEDFLTFSLFSPIVDWVPS